MSAVEVLTTVREALSDPERWCQGDLLQPSGYDVAARCCLIGGTLIAAIELGVDGYGYDADRYLAKAVAGESYESVDGFNDDPSTTHADILAVLDRAIELAREEEGS